MSRIARTPDNFFDKSVPQESLVTYMVFPVLLLSMRSWKLSPFVALLFAILLLCSLFTGCTSIQNFFTPPVTPETTPETTPVATAIITSGPVSQTVPTEPIRTQASDSEFVVSIDASQARILTILEGIDTEISKPGIDNGTAPDYNALGSYSRRLAATADEEIIAMSKFRVISDPANESRKMYYVNYLVRLKPFAASLETGSALAQKKEFSTASGFFSNAKNDLSLVRSQELPGHLQIITRIKENFGPFLDIIQKQATVSFPG